MWENEVHEAFAFLLFFFLLLLFFAFIVPAFLYHEATLHAT
jgi:hypothetical protein